MSSQSESKLPEFLQNFSPISLHYRKPISHRHPWVFWSEYEGCENNSTSADVGTPINIHDKIISALSNIQLLWGFVAQFWAPVTIGGRRLLSTSAQPFAAWPLSNKLAKYRLNSEKYKYTIDDANQLAIEPKQMIKSGGPATAFLNRRTSITKLQRFLAEFDDYWRLSFTLMLPICLPSQSICIGVLEFTFVHPYCPLANLIYDTVKAIKDVGLDVFYVQHLIPYKTINGLKLAKDHIEKALKVVCESHDLALAQVWIPYEDKTRVFLPSSLEDTQTKQLLAIKFTGCYYTMKDGAFNHFGRYFRFSDVTPRAIGEEFPLVTLQDHLSRYIPKVRSDMVMCWGLSMFPPTSALAICLRSNDTNDCNYVFEFMWKKDSNFIHLEALLLTLKRCLPRFKFASGVEIGQQSQLYSDMSSQSNISKFLQTFSPICLHYRKPISYRHPWVFWSEYEGSEHNSSSADVGTPIIYDKIKYALSNIYCYWWLLAQFWAPVTIGGRRLLSTSAQPFAVSSLFNEQAKYRLNSDKYKYTIDDANQLAIEPEQMIKSGGPATAFLNRRTYMTKLPGFLSESDDYGGLDFSVMIPICFPSQSNCIGVLELTLDRSEGLLAYIIFRTVKAIKKAGLDVFYVQDLIPYNVRLPK